MKQKVTPLAIVVGIIFVAIVAYASYHFAFQKQSPPASADNAPGYVKTIRDNPNATGGAPGGGPPAGVNPGYGQGEGYQPGRGPGAMRPMGGGAPSYGNRPGGGG